MQVRWEMEAFAACSGREKEMVFSSALSCVCVREGERDILINNKIRLERGERVEVC